MKPIESFTIDHTKLYPGLYASRKDRYGDTTLTTFDLRMKKPNVEPVLGTDSVHALEHLGATYLRNHPDYASRIVYFGPMGCRTGFYLILEGNLESRDIVPLIIELFEFMAGYEQEIPGASEVECGNFRDMNLEDAKKEANDYLQLLKSIPEDRLHYPQ
ncbi:S-ribosylhomocysteine lyase [Alkalibacter rhizosphaerae]|uniref:S-ribosylhomocysteine lyase n=1 Tax=Alkalibacter rhizosphaerae TaxID=2815577 RepID=A0A974XHS2_9FIRM|nr:S-ribosylhomocysteine lyase [Alkalibacter rhizosphaerae]QSX08970.1 S-ribosylhomocysteine lyase [Alkalibacter rhizosphaerae]